LRQDKMEKEIHMTYQEALEQVEAMQGRVAYKERQIQSLIN